jgi:hypothetical protein
LLNFTGSYTASLDQFSTWLDDQLVQEDIGILISHDLVPGRQEQITIVFDKVEIVTARRDEVGIEQ